MTEGGCFCGAIRYRLLSAPGAATACHCSKCRKAFGGAGSVYSPLGENGEFAWTQGREMLSVYASQAGWGLGFCSVCGSTLCGLHEGRVHGVTLGSLDGDANVHIGQHIFVDSKAAWDHIGGDAPQFSEHPSD